MADTKITALTAITTVDPAVDVLPIVDVSDTTMAASGTTKKITSNQILGAGGTATLASATITGDLTVNTNVLKVDSTNDRVGIVNASPTYPLDVVGTGRFVQTNFADNIFRLSTGGSTTGNINQILFADQATSATAAITAYNSAFGSGKNYALGFTTNGSERYLIDSTGISTWSVGGSTAMTLNSTGLALGMSISSPWATNRRVLQIGGTNSGAIALTGTSGSGELFFNSFFNSSSQNICVVTGGTGKYDFNVSTVGCHTWSIGTGTAGNAFTFTQAMTLDTTGNLHVGTTAYVGVGSNFVNSLNGFNIVPNNTGSASNRNWQLAANGSAAGNLDFTVSSANNTYPNSAYRMQLTSAGALNNTTGTYGTISDLRLKENISDARNYLADLLKLRVVKYSLKEESSAVATKLGFIAQEVELVFPNLVDQSDKEYDGAEGIRSVKTSILIPMLLKAIQELTARVQTLEAR
jgi:hypothetical protein